MRRIEQNIPAFNLAQQMLGIIGCTPVRQT